ncbi:MAG: hypothetical protein JSU86_04420 [Phycisphaerales bacterium]|nr:MAG: hypothetical protein JSU86_04420 [Phycisphaerales bacterium]
MAEIKTKTDNPIAVEDPNGGYAVKLPKSVRNDLEMMRKVAHRMVDEVAERGLLSWLLETVEENLGTLTDDIIGEFVLKLVNEATGKKEAPANPLGPPGADW